MITLLKITRWVKQTNKVKFSSSVHCSDIFGGTKNESSALSFALRLLTILYMMEKYDHRKKHARAPTVSKYIGLGYVYLQLLILWSLSPISFFTHTFIISRFFKGYPCTLFLVISNIITI